MFFRLTVTVLLIFCGIAPAATSRYALILDDPAPAAQLQQAGRAQLRAMASRLTPVHDGVKSQLRNRGIHVTGEVFTILNAVFVDADPQDVAALSSIPGVRYAAPIQRVKPLLDRATQLI